MLRNYSDLTRNEGRWIIFWAAVDSCTKKYLGAFTRDEIRQKAQQDRSWISVYQYRRAWTRLDETRPLQGFNGLTAGTTIHDFTGFCLSPVHESANGDVTVCCPEEAGFWSVYGFHRNAEEWQLVHDCGAHDTGEVLARIEDATGERIEYRDADRSYANTTLTGLRELFWQRLADERAAPDHPLAVIRDQIAAALEAREV